MTKKPLYFILISTLLLSLGLMGCQTQSKAPAADAPAEDVAAATKISPTNTPPSTPEKTIVPTDPPPTLPPAATPTNPPTVTPAPTNTPTPLVPLVTVDVTLNVRSGPGVNFERVGKLQAGDQATIVGRSETGWWQISFAGAPEGTAWISGDYGEARNVDNVPLVAAPPTPTPSGPTATPPPPTPEPSPTPPPVDFVVKGYRLWSNEENGGSGLNGSVTNCGYGHNINVQVVDAAGNPLDGVVIGDIYGNTAQITGSKGPGRAEFLIYNGTGWELFVKEYAAAGRPVTSEQSPVLGGNASQIPIELLIGAHYCATVEECQFRTENNSLCFSHYSWDITFQRTW